MASKKNTGTALGNGGVRRIGAVAAVIESAVEDAIERLERARKLASAAVKVATPARNAEQVWSILAVAAAELQAAENLCYNPRRRGELRPATGYTTEALEKRLDTAKALGIDFNPVARHSVPYTPKEKKETTEVEDVVIDELDV